MSISLRIASRLWQFLLKGLWIVFRNGYHNYSTKPGTLSIILNYHFVFSFLITMYNRYDNIIVAGGFVAAQMGLTVQHGILNAKMAKVKWHYLKVTLTFSLTHRAILGCFR